MRLSKVFKQYECIKQTRRNIYINLSPSSQFIIQINDSFLRDAVNNSPNTINKINQVWIMENSMLQTNSVI